MPSFKAENVFDHNQQSMFQERKYLHFRWREMPLEILSVCSTLKESEHLVRIKGRRTQFTSTKVVSIKILYELELLKIYQNQ